MKKLFLYTPLLLLLIANVDATGQRRFDFDERETLRQTLEFSPDNGKKTLEVDNVNGRIRVTGYDGRNVEMIANKTIRARSQTTLQIARQDVRLDIADKAETISIYVDQPGHERSTVSSSRS